MKQTGNTKDILVNSFSELRRKIKALKYFGYVRKGSSYVFETQNKRARYVRHIILIDPNGN